MGETPHKTHKTEQDANINLKMTYIGKAAETKIRADKQETYIYVCL